MLGKMSFQKVQRMDKVLLYAGDIPRMQEYRRKDIVGLSLNVTDRMHIQHDITESMPLNDEVIDAYQAEDVFEHIEYEKLTNVINEIYRVLKPNGYFRLSVPDYRCDVLYTRSWKNEDGDVIFDPYGGGQYVNGKVIDGGHLWFPTYESVCSLIENSNFERYVFYHYYDTNGVSVTNRIDYSKGYIMRTPDNDERVSNPYRAMSIVVDMYK